MMAATSHSLSHPAARVGIQDTAIKDWAEQSKPWIKAVQESQIPVLKALKHTLLQIERQIEENAVSRPALNLIVKIFDRSEVRAAIEGNIGEINRNLNFDSLRATVAKLDACAVMQPESGNNIPAYLSGLAAIRLLGDAEGTNSAEAIVFAQFAKLLTSAFNEIKTNSAKAPKIIKAEKEIIDILRGNAVDASISWSKIPAAAISLLGSLNDSRSTAEVEYAQTIHTLKQLSEQRRAPSSLGTYGSFMDELSKLA